MTAEHPLTVTMQASIWPLVLQPQQADIHVLSPCCGASAHTTSTPGCREVELSLEVVTLAAQGGHIMRLCCMVLMLIACTQACIIV